MRLYTIKTYSESDIKAAITDLLSENEIQYGSRTDPYGVGFYNGTTESLYDILDRMSIEDNNEYYND